MHMHKKLNKEEQHIFKIWAYFVVLDWYQYLFCVQVCTNHSTQKQILSCVLWNNGVNYYYENKNIATQKTNASFT